MTKQLKEIEIPFGAKDSELCGWEYTIPEGMEATIVDNKIVVKKKDSEGERIRKALIQYLKDYPNLPNGSYCRDDFFAWLEKQGAKVSAIEGLETELEKQGEQKLAWSEEDETALCDALWCCKQAASIAKDENDMGNVWYAERWLKSLKDRFGCEVNCTTTKAWSEEDEGFLDSAL